MRTLPCPSLTPAEWAWCAGLFEGEGCIGFVADCRVVVTVAMHVRDRDVLERLDALWPSPSGLYWRDRDHMLAWRISARERVEGFLSGIYPWLGMRRQSRADEAFERLRHNMGRSRIQARRAA